MSELVYANLYICIYNDINIFVLLYCTINTISNIFSNFKKIIK